VPVEKWLAGPWRKDLDLLQSGTLVEREGYIQGPALRAEIDRAISAGGASEQLLVPRGLGAMAAEPTVGSAQS